MPSTFKPRRKAAGVYHVTCRDKHGRVKWMDVCPNALFNEGEQLVLDVALRGGTAPTTWALGLMKNTLAALPALTSTLASLNTAGPYEPTSASNSGYSARLTVARSTVGWPTLALSGSYYQATTLTGTWTAGANWTDTMRWLFLTTNTTVGDTTGKLVSMAQLSKDRLLVSADTLSVYYNLALQ